MSRRPAGIGVVSTRRRTWPALLGTEPPPPPEVVARGSTVVLSEGVEFVPEPDPFDPLETLFDLDPFDFGGEGPSGALAHQEGDGEWSSEEAAVQVTTTLGIVLLESDRLVEVRVDDRIVDKYPGDLAPGDALLVGRRQGRVGLIDALEERLVGRTDLLAARLLVDDLRSRIRHAIAESGLGIVELHRHLVDLGTARGRDAVRNWITEVTMAPQAFEDLERLNTALRLGMTNLRLRELFTAVQHRRVFRRSAGRLLAAAARGATVVEDDSRVDDETGLSIADLRDAVVEASVISVRQCDEPVPISLLGRLEIR